MMSGRIVQPLTPIPKQAVKEKFEFGPWTCSSSKSHILKSEGVEREEYEAELNLPHLPEMVFDKNSLRIEHQAGFGIQFTALDALKLVDDENDSIKVAETEEWLAARSDSEHVKRVINPFDWTFTTEYSGTLFGHEMVVMETDEKIDIERLKQREKIHFMADILLYEDELHDSGASLLDVKMRVMPEYFFILLRFFMRVDQVMIRIHDTRIFHQAGSDYLLREVTRKQSRIKDLKVPVSFYTDPLLINDHLTTVYEKREKLQFPSNHNSATVQPKPSARLAATPISILGHSTS